MLIQDLVFLHFSASKCTILSTLKKIRQIAKPKHFDVIFFFRIQVADPEYKKAFDDELVAFKARIKNRAKEKIAEQIADAEKEEEMDRQARLGPGGLDPVEVFESLPDVRSINSYHLFHMIQYFLF